MTEDMHADDIGDFELALAMLTVHDVRQIATVLTERLASESTPCRGAVTTPNGSEVTCGAAPSYEHACPDCPCRSPCRSAQGRGGPSHCRREPGPVSAAPTAASRTLGDLFVGGG